MRQQIWVETLTDRVGLECGLSVYFVVQGELHCAYTVNDYSDAGRCFNQKDLPLNAIGYEIPQEHYDALVALKSGGFKTSDLANLANLIN